MGGRGHGTRRDLRDDVVAGPDTGMVCEHPRCHPSLHLPHRSLFAVREDQGRGGLVNTSADTSEGSAWAGTWILLLLRSVAVAQAGNPVFFDVWDPEHELACARTCTYAQRQA